MINLSSVTNLKEIADQIGQANAELTVLTAANERLTAENNRLGSALSHNLATLVNKERQAKAQDDANKWQADRIGRLDALVNEKEAALARAMERIALLEKNASLPRVTDSILADANRRLLEERNEARADSGVWKEVAGDAQKKLEVAARMIDDLRGAWKTLHDDNVKLAGDLKIAVAVRDATVAERDRARKELDKRDCALAAYAGCLNYEHRVEQADARAEAWRAISVESDTKFRASEQEVVRLKGELQVIINAVRNAIYTDRSKQ